MAECVILYLIIFSKAIHFLLSCCILNKFFNPNLNVTIHIKYSCNITLRPEQQAVGF